MSLSEAQNNPLVSINTLPTEILAQIFYFAAETERCAHYNDKSDEISPSALLESLPQVCTYWRQLSTSLCSLWSHIDLIDWGDPCEHLYNRARLWVERARDGPLDIHIHGRSSYQAETFKELANFLAPLMKQIRSLETKGNASPRLLESVFGCWFNNGTPGTLNTVFLYDCWRIPVHSVAPAVPGSSRLETWSEKFEEFFRPVTVLRLRGAFVPLNSHAYHGLIELQLLSTSTRTRFSQIQLRMALSSSPRLRTLTLNMDIADPTPEDAQCPPVRLEDLEELGVAESFCHFGNLLEILAPGSKPLTMSLNLSPKKFPNQLDAELDDFFKRSKVVALCIKGYSSRKLFPLAFELLPHLHTLFLQDQAIMKHCLPVDDTYPTRTYSMCLQLRNLYMSECAWYAQGFKDFCASHSISSLGIHNCTFIDHDGDSDDTSPEQMKRLITKIHPHVKHLNSVDFERALRLWDFGGVH
ncbi:hypothetical protein BDV93DRAFT_520068 [Ceratobasidium sp. AG-I]|nr:hypothetical protein BDV93DRAFT_520068 [Ceratobasidium sp. AG-I]